MTAREIAQRLLNERAAFPVGSPDWEYRTRAAWKLIWLMRGVPAAEWVA